MPTKFPQPSLPHTKPQAILFDLDGTLLDSAPDLAEAMNLVLDDRGLTRIGFSELRSMAGAGARGMIGVALGLGPDDADYAATAEAFFQHYLRLDNQMSEPFAGVLELLTFLEGASIAWGIVTNKATRFTEPALRSHSFLQRAQTVVSGDTTPYSKPHPEPLLEAARRMGVAPHACWYVGDDKRDMDAARAAGMHSVAACWGYIGAHPIETWPADLLMANPSEIIDMMGLIERCA